MSEHVPQTYRIGSVVVSLYDGYTVTRFPDGTETHARHDDVAQLGQGRMATELGYPSIEAMNVDHDPLHALLFLWLGHQGMSPVLQSQAAGTAWPYAHIEETAVLAIQRLMVVLGIDVHMLLRRWGT